MKPEGSMNMLIQNGVCIDGENRFHADILIEDGLIAQVSEHIDAVASDSLRVIDASGRYVFPGLIDAHTHYHLVSRNTVTADSFAQGSRLAAFGGVTCVVDFADHQREKTLEQSMADRRQSMEQGMSIDFSLHQGVYRMHGRIAEELAALKASGVSVIKIFTTYKNVGYLIDSEGLEQLFASCRDLGIMVTVHAEDDTLIEELSSAHGDKPCPPAEHPSLRPAEAEARAITAVGELAGSLDMPVYIVHLSSEEGLKAFNRLRAQGVKIYAETTPHYLQLTDDLLEGEDAPLYLMTPPLRKSSDNQALWNAVREEEISLIATDHCAFTREQKLSSFDCRTILPGIPGTEEMLPLIHTHGVAAGRITLEQMVKLLSVNPAKFFGLYPRKGSFEIGSDADIVLFDPDENWQIGDRMHSASGYSAYSGTKVVGKAVTTIRRGEILADHDQYTGKPGSGRMIDQGVPEVYR
jgi:dihydropyrimidinase